MGDAGCCRGMKLKLITRNRHAKSVGGERQKEGCVTQGTRGPYTFRYMFRSWTYRDGADEDVGPRGVDLVLREVVEERLHLGPRLSLRARQ